MVKINARLWDRIRQINLDVFIIMGLMSIGMPDGVQEIFYGQEEVARELLEQNGEGTEGLHLTMDNGHSVVDGEVREDISVEGAD